MEKQVVLFTLGGTIACRYDLRHSAAVLPFSDIPGGACGGCHPDSMLDAEARPDLGGTWGSAE